MGNGNGTFQPQTTYAVGPTQGDSVITIAMGDLNGDGRTDLAVTNNDGNSVSILLNSGGNANRTPTVANPIANQTWTEGQSSTFVFPSSTFSDPDGDTLTYTARLGSGDILPSWLTFNASTRTFAGTPPAGSADLTVRLTASDGSLRVAEEFTITTPASNRTPSVSAPLADQSWREGTAFSFVVPTTTFSDPDGDTLTYTARLSNGDILPSWLTFDSSTRIFTGTPPAGSADLTVRLTASDGSLRVSDEFTLATPASNGSPMVASPIANQSWNEEITSSFVMPDTVFSDPDGDLLTYSARMGNGDILPSWLTFNASTRTFAGTPPAGSADLTVRVTASDGSLNVMDEFTIATPTPIATSDIGESRTTATILTLRSNRTIANSSIDPEDDQDWFRVRLTANRTYFFRMAGRMNSIPIFVC